MQVSDLSRRLGYIDSPNFLGSRQAVFQKTPDFGHIFRRARAGAGLQGVYVLRPSEAAAEAVVPVVYVCRAPTLQKADEIHRLVWNQDVVPFLMVHTRAGIRLYSGFRHVRAEQGTLEGVLATLTDFNRLDDVLGDFSAESIDNGSLWRNRGRDITPGTRVNWRLLGNLRTLDHWLQRQGVDKEPSHALIGKYVYLHYLRDRGILSPKKLQRWKIEPASIFGSQATLQGVDAVVKRLDDWLNGTVFPLNLGPRCPFDQEQLRCVAGVFEGDEVSEVGDRQLSLDFKAYDFSYIPIETLSVVYEQFLHAPKTAEKPAAAGERSAGRQLGAYYTPIPVINLMLSELEERRPLTKGMRVLDPSCGSGAFLVQCYRRLIEKEFPPGSNPKPRELRDLLKAGIFGVDCEADACNIAELSLVLALLDYVDPPDLEGARNGFKLPKLRNENIFCLDFFGEATGRQEVLQSKFDWVVGNPPWKRLKPKQLRREEKALWKWMQRHRKAFPVGGNQAARAFAWEAGKYLASDGEAALFLPAMTLFEDPAKDFRRSFFREMKVHTVVNFANLAEVLSAGRFRVPGAAFFYRPRPDANAPVDEDEIVRTYNPLVANQEPTRPVRERTRNESWSIVINASEIRDIPTAHVMNGSGLPWKLATWGSAMDERLLTKLERHFRSLGDLEDDLLIVAEGPALEAEHVPEGDKRNVRVEEVVDKRVLDVKELARWRNIFSIPRAATKNNANHYASVRRGSRGLAVCRPPHVIVSAAGTFAIYTEEYLIMRPRQIGIGSATDDTDFLKALSLYLSSDFAFYHQFFASTELGVKRDRATLRALRQMPVGIANMTRSQLKVWTDLHAQLVRTRPVRVGDVRRKGATNESQSFLPFDPDDDNGLLPLIEELNTMVADSLALTEGERALIHDLVRIRLELNDGRTGEPAVRRPTEPELRGYARRLKAELDAFLGGRLPKRHDVAVVYDELSGMVAVDLVAAGKAARGVLVARADARTARELEHTRQRLRQQRAQWVYFDRNLRIYEGTRTFIFKPMQRFHWTESQAMLDAREVIAETLEGAGAERD